MLTLIKSFKGQPDDRQQGSDSLATTTSYGRSISLPSSPGAAHPHTRNGSGSAPPSREVVSIRGDQELDIMHCLSALMELRPRLQRERFVGLIKTMYDEEGYRLAGIRSLNGPDFAAVCGYRVTRSLAQGRTLVIDDLVTSSTSRAQGLAGTLLDHCIALARQLGCTSLQLHSGHDRHAAHRLYLNKGARIDGHHFTLALD